MGPDHSRLYERDDSAADGINLNEVRAELRIFLPIRMHTLNKSGNIYSKAGNEAKALFCKSV
jgi:hypothetical protein